MLNVKQICIDESACSWEVHYECAAHLTDGLMQAAAEKLAVAFSLQKVVFVSDDGKGAFEGLPKDEAPEAEFTNSDDMHSYDDIPLPEEPPDVEIGATNPPEPPCVVEEVNVYEQAYEQAYNRLYGEKKDDGLLWGKPIKKGKVRPIDSIIEEENKVIVEGEFVKTLDKDSNLIAFNEREMRTKDISLSFNLCDGTGGLFIKMRFSAKDGNDAKAECKQLTSVLKPGMRLRIQGNVAPDRFNNDEMTLTPFGIMKIDVPERKDNAEVKRVELHCHTKMSKMDGLTPMKDLVKKAIKWGHKALAITDHGVVQAFPFCYDAAQGSDLKLIFGMEGYLISDRAEIKDELDQEAVETKKKTSRNKIKSNHIIILAKNETGLRNLYKLVSISHLRYLSGRPLLPRKVLEQHRDGLILGSACEAGELYRAMMAGASEETLEEIASFYDYLEIQPTGNNMFLVHKNICTVKQIEEYNRRIYELGKRMGKLTVATGDVHFLNPEDEKYRAILQAPWHKEGEVEYQPPLYYRTTEEMLEEFAYLGEEVAYEVCVTNTNKVADMVERIKPVPDTDQLYSPSIPGAEDAVRNMTYAKAHEWYGNPLPQLVE
ncbi:MAG: PHP domain-containing protein, partial [Phascolarctobacterium sp.]|nr:PHP domain-containing protein [Phascolarctobacterium sp.]